MINKDKLIASFEEIVGWPYVSPGTNDRNGIDCSGAFVRAYKAQGASIYHGSNRIVRAYCSDTFSITGADQLEPGMAVFKMRADGQEPAEYKPGGKYYDPDLIGNYYHIGLVCGVSPLRIIHATTPVAKVDTALGSWAWAAHLDAVDYGSTSKPQPSSPDSAWGTVAVVSGGLNMRETAGPNGKYMLSIPNNSRIPILRTTAVGSALWGLTQWTNPNGTHTGWVLLSYVAMDADADVEAAAPELQPGDMATSDGWRWALVAEAERLLQQARTGVGG